MNALSSRKRRRRFLATSHNSKFCEIARPFTILFLAADCDEGGQGWSCERGACLLAGAPDGGGERDAQPDGDAATQPDGDAASPVEPDAGDSGQPDAEVSPDSGPPPPPLLAVDCDEAMGELTLPPEIEQVASTRYGACLVADDEAVYGCHQSGASEP